MFDILKNGEVGIILGKDQLHNAVELLIKGYNLHEQVEPLLETYGSIDKIPAFIEKED